AETCATLNRTWGYSKFDDQWKKPEEIVRLLADVVSKNANYLLNIGPDALGRVPEGSVKVLREVGRWLQTHGEAIYATEPSPFPVNFDWGTVTRRPGKLYFHIFSTNVDELKLVGIDNRIKRACFLDDPEHECPVTQRYIEVEGQEKLAELSVPVTPAPNAAPHRVLALEYEGELNVRNDDIQQADGSVVLESLRAVDAQTGESIAPRIMQRGAVASSLKEGNRIQWRFLIHSPGEFAVIADCAAGRYTDHGGRKVIDTGHLVSFEVEDQSLSAEIKDGERSPIRGNPHWQCVRSKLGSLKFSRPGWYTLTMTVDRVNIDAGGGLILRNISLQPVS
ncbi:MAG: hypothetical protein D6820_10305, partial [Lentisphaerae bacterium]